MYIMKTTRVEDSAYTQTEAILTFIIITHNDSKLHTCIYTVSIAEHVDNQCHSSVYNLKTVIQMFYFEWPE